MRAAHLLAFAVLAAVAVFAPALSGASFVSAQTSPIRVVSEQPENNFPQGVNFKLEAASVAPIRDVSLRFFVGTGRVTRLAKPEVTAQGNSATAQYTLRLTGAQYSPPGTLIEYWYEVTDAAGNSLETPHRTFPFMDNRFTWQQLQEGLLTVFYYGPVRTRAETALRASVETNERMGRLMEVQIKSSWRIFMYNNIRDMVDVLPFSSQLIRNTLVTEGTVFGDERVMFVLGDDPQFRGVVSHEVTHMLVHEATEPNVGLVPVWLNEGLAEYGNIQPGPTYDAYLQSAIRRNSLLSIYALTGRVGTPDDVLLLYGQARSLVAYLVETQGGPKMAALLRAIKSGTAIDPALQQVYGFDRAGLERRWRQAIGAPVADSTTPVPVLAPTAAPVPTLAPFGFQPSPTPRPQPTGTVVAPTAQAAATAVPTSGGGGCNALAKGEADPSLGAALGFVLVGAGLRLRRRK